jgi:hypothetical protein
MSGFLLFQEVAMDEVDALRSAYDSIPCFLSNFFCCASRDFKKREQVMPSALGKDEADAGNPEPPGLSKDGVGRPIHNLGANILDKRLDLALHRVEAGFG